jgi:hypothetical protein
LDATTEFAGAVGFGAEIPEAGADASVAVEEGVKLEAGAPVATDKGAGAAALETKPKSAGAAGFGVEIPEVGTDAIAAFEGEGAESETEDPDAGRAPAMRSRARSEFKFRLLAPNPDSKTEFERPESARFGPVNASPVTETGDPPADDEAWGAPTGLSCAGEECRRTLANVSSPDDPNAELESAVPLSAF